MGTRRGLILLQQNEWEDVVAGSVAEDRTVSGDEDEDGDRGEKGQRRRRPVGRDLLMPGAATRGARARARAKQCEAALVGAELG